MNYDAVSSTALATQRLSIIIDIYNHFMSAPKIVMILYDILYESAVVKKHCYSAEVECSGIADWIQGYMYTLGRRGLRVSNSPVSS